MKFVVITHVEHCLRDGEIYGYGPYIREMNLWFKYVDEVILVAPVSKKAPSEISLAYKHGNLKLLPIPAISLTSISKIFRTLFFLPAVKWKIFNALRKADHIHLRCPGNIGLLGCLVQIYFPKKPKTAKYAGNWDPFSKQPLSYRLQKWMLGNIFLTKNMQVLVYGDWPSQSKNIKSFFTATYPEDKLANSPLIEIKEPFRFIFVGSLVKGKRPLYAIKILESLYQKGINCSLDIYGEGIERSTLEDYIIVHKLKDRVRLYGNQISEIVEKAYKEAHFLILPSKSEGWPKVVAEAMFWGCIPIATKISCVPWMLNNGERGILLDMDFDRDVSYVLSLLSQSKKLNEIRLKAQSWSQNYTLDTLESEIVKLL